MRLIIDSLVALMLVAVLGGMVLHHRNERVMEEQLQMTRTEVRRFQSQIILQAAMEKTELNPRGNPVSIDARWFAANPPRNPLLPTGHPWVQVAEYDERDMQHPRKRIATHRSVAQFWYNPDTGVVRARVPFDVSDATALRLYNYVNESKLSSVFYRGRDRLDG